MSLTHALGVDRARVGALTSQLAAMLPGFSVCSGFNFRMRGRCRSMPFPERHAQDRRMTQP